MAHPPREAPGHADLGVRVRPAGGGSATVRSLWVRWVCQDPCFAFRDPTGRTPAPVPRCGP